MSKRTLLSLGWILIVVLVGTTGCEDWDWPGMNNDDAAAEATDEDVAPEPSAEQIRIEHLESQVSELSEENRALESHVFTLTQDQLRMQADMDALKLARDEQSRMIEAQNIGLQERDALKVQVEDLQQELLIRDAERELLMTENRTLQADLEALRVRYNSLAQQMGIVPEAEVDSDAPAEDALPVATDDEVIMIDE